MEKRSNLDLVAERGSAKDTTALETCAKDTTTFETSPASSKRRLLSRHRTHPMTRFAIQAPSSVLIKKLEDPRTVTCNHRDPLTCSSGSQQQSETTTMVDENSDASSITDEDDEEVDHSANGRTAFFSEAEAKTAMTEFIAEPKTGKVSLPRRSSTSFRAFRRSNRIMTYPLPVGRPLPPAPGFPRSLPSRSAC